MTSCPGVTRLRTVIEFCIAPILAYVLLKQVQLLS